MRWWGSLSSLQGWISPKEAFPSFVCCLHAQPADSDTGGMVSLTGCVVGSGEQWPLEHALCVGHSHVMWWLFFNVGMVC